MSPLFALVALAPAVTSPKAFFGHEIGADYVLPNYQQLTAYWKKLDAESDRITVRSIGKTEEGRDQLMAIVTSERNTRRLEHYRGIAKRLALADGVDEAAARKLSQEGKAVVWIDGGLHATETLGAQQLMETVYQMVSREDPEARRIRDEVIILFVHANPDGHDLVSDWYMRNPDPTRRSYANLPRLYQKYTGHDNNRDFYASTQKETKNMNRVMYREWFPQVMYNHHQTGPRGTVMFAPPFRPPFNHHVDPLVMSGVELVGSAMHNRFIQEGKPGTTMRTGAGYSAWWNGGLRTTAYFHNIVGILTETIGSPNPMEIPFVAERQVMNGDLLFPIEPQTWRFRQSVDYSVTANMSILDLAARRKEHFLYGIWRMGRNAIDKGRRDTWTNYPARVAKAVADAGRNTEEAQKLLRDPSLRDARAYVIPSDQPDFPTAIKFANALIENGVFVHRLTRDHGQYKAGSLVVKADQAFRPHVLDMFEPQDHPNDIPAPGAPPTPPYDNAGWTLAFQMGVQFDRLLEAFEGPLELVPDVMTPPAASFPTSLGAGYRLPAAQNNTFTLVQRLLAAGVPVHRFAGSAMPGVPAVAADFFVADSARSKEVLAKGAKDLGVRVESTGVDAREGLWETRAPRVALWDVYGGSMPSGWIRWILEQFEIPFKVVYAPELNAGGLHEKFDVLILPGGAIPSGRGRGQNFPSNLPKEFEAIWGTVTVEDTVPQLKAFLEEGGRIVAIGSSTNLAYHLGLPVESVVAGFPRAKYYIPGSILQARVDNAHPAAWGMPEKADFFFDESPVFRFKEGAQGVSKVAWFETDKPLRSGWAWGQEVLKDGIVGFTAEVGDGRLYAWGPEITFRAQPHGTFKLLFNALYP